MTKIEAKVWSNVIDGDNTLRVDMYDDLLNENSIIFDVGGYVGEWSEKMFKKYNCFIYIFEPIKEYYDLIMDKFKENFHKIKVYNFGLSNTNKTEYIEKRENGSSSLVTGTERIEIKSISEFVKNNKFNKNKNKNIDVIKINIEGDEYSLLKDLIDNNLLNKFNNYQIQFHDFVEYADTYKSLIYNKLKVNFFQIYCFDYIWENWTKKSMLNCTKVSEINHKIQTDLIKEVHNLEENIIKQKEDYKLLYEKRNQENIELREIIKKLSDTIEEKEKEKEKENKGEKDKDE